MNFNDILTQFASSPEAKSGDMFSSIGIDWTLLALQSIGFLILLFILKKWVYPPLLNMLDKRDESLKASADAAMEAERMALEAQAKTAELIDEAKTEASEIVASAHEEATKSAEAISKKAELKADSMLKSAQDEMKKEIDQARKQLKDEVLDLVVLATGKVVDGQLDSKTDSKVIKKAIEG